MNLLLILLALLYLSTDNYAQKVNCGNIHFQHEHMNVQESTTFQPIQKSIEIGSGICEEQFIIPVVFHVFNNNGASAIPQNQIQSALDKATEDFNMLNSDTSTIDPLFFNRKKGLKIKFVLASQDPSGTTTTGINYYSTMSGFGGTNVNNLIASYAWDNYKYLNIYVMRDLYNDGVTNNSGVAWYPDAWMSNNGIARIVYNDLYLGSSGTSIANSEFQSVFTHEMGHFFNLKHTFENSCLAGGDDVSDTPPTVGSAGCTNAWSCGNYTNGENYMDYNSTCYKMFTEGQIKRVKDALYFHSTRNVLWKKDNLIATGTYNNYSFPNYTPESRMIVSDTTIFVGQTITFKDISCYLPDSRQWSFSGGIPNSSTNTIENVTYNTAGIYPVTLVASNSNGVGNILTVNIHVIDCQITENFESNNTLPSGWSQLNGGNTTFSSYGVLSYNNTNIPPNEGSKAIYCNENWNSSTGAPNTLRLISNPIDLTSANQPRLSYSDIRLWDNLWPITKNIHTIELQIATSQNGPWTVLKTDSVSQNQINEWRDIQNINLDAYSGQQIYLAWYTNTHHYYWRIDNICIHNTGVISNTVKTEVTSRKLDYSFKDNILQTTTDFYLYNIHGQLIYTGKRNIPINIQSLATGIYVIKGKDKDAYAKIIKN